MPNIFDNITDETRLGLVLRESLKDFDTVDVATGYLDLRGWSSFADIIDAKPVPVPGGRATARILVGMIAPSEPEQLLDSLQEQVQTPAYGSDIHDREKALARRDRLVKHLRTQLMRGLATTSGQQTLQTLKRQLHDGLVSMKVFTEKPLHGKTYIFHSPGKKHGSCWAYVGSSNLTGAGLHNNLELNIDVQDSDATGKLSTWFDEVAADPRARKYLRPFVGADELLSGAKRWCLWLVNLDVIDFDNSPVLSRRISAVRQMRLASTKKATRDAANTAELFMEIRQPRVAYLAIPAHVSETRKYFTAKRFDSTVICGNANFAAADPDGFLFAIISSSMFITWQSTVGGRLESRLRFSNTIVWNNLPLPDLDRTARAAIVSAGEAVQAARGLFQDMTLADLYRPNAMPKELEAAHNHLDLLVDRAFGAPTDSPTLAERQRLLFDRYEQLTAPLLAARPSTRQRVPR